MLSPELLRQTLDTANVEFWERERTAPRDWLFSQRGTRDSSTIRRTTLSSSNLLVGTSVADSVPDPPEAQPKRVAVDETAVKINDERSRLCAAINLDTKLILGVDLFWSHETDWAVAFLHGLSKKCDLSEAVFLVGGFDYQTALARLGLSSRLAYANRNLIKKWFQTFKMSIDRFQNSLVGSRAGVVTGIHSSHIIITFSDRING